MESSRSVPEAVTGTRGTASGSTDVTVLLVRHAHTTAVGLYLAGRAAGVALSDAGRSQRTLLADAMSHLPMAAVYSSPLERALQTAMPLAERRGLRVRIREDLTEVDFGAWTGKRFTELAQLPEWRAYNTHRATAPVPGGEDASALTARVTSALESIRIAHAGACVAVVTHAEVIRAALLSYLRLSLDRFHQFEIEPASVTSIVLSMGGARVVTINECPAAALR
jgi:broad specificity phosphatase PhoE